MKGGARISVKAAAVIVLVLNENELWPLKEPFPALIAPAIASRSSYVFLPLQISPYVGNSTDKKITFQHLERSWTAWVESG